ncbi:hypothetical protein [Deinococcus sp.]|uniref:hypothetical protein n=1 Tax=Deinococcus sp. TaxID=47478 RepID=UPI003B594B47
MNKLLTLGLFGALALPAAFQTAAAQTDMPEIPPIAAPAETAPLPEILPSTPTPSVPNMPTSNLPAAPAKPAAPVYGTLDKVNAALGVPRTVSGEFTLSLALQNKQATSMNFSAGRDSEQNCAAAPAVRVLQVGTRTVVYPTGEQRICTQEMTSQTAPAGGTATFKRTLKLPAGEYMVEGWFQGFAGGTGNRVKVSAPPVRITVK